MTCEDRYQSLKGGGVGAQGCWFPSEVERGTFTMSQADNNWDPLHPSDSFSSTNKLGQVPDYQISKILRCNLATLTTYYKNKWEIIRFMEGYFVVGVTTIPYPRFGVIINIVSKDDIPHPLTIDNIPPVHMPRLYQISS